MRCVALKPELLLFDEPTSSPDPEHLGDVHWRAEGRGRRTLGMIGATHELDFARQVADELLLMNGGVCSEQSAATDLLTAPKEERAQQVPYRLLNPSERLASTLLKVIPRRRWQVSFPKGGVDSRN